MRRVENFYPGLFMMSCDNQETIYQVLDDDRVVVTHKIRNGQIIPEIGLEYDINYIDWIFNEYTDQV